MITRHINPEGLHRSAAFSQAHVVAGLGPEYLVEIDAIAVV